MDYSMGIDLHRKYFVATIVDEDGEVTRRDRVSTDRLAIEGYLGGLDGKKPGSWAASFPVPSLSLVDTVARDGQAATSGKRAASGIAPRKSASWG